MICIICNINEVNKDIICEECEDEINNGYDKLDDRTKKRIINVNRIERDF